MRCISLCSGSLHLDDSGEPVDRFRQELADWPEVFQSRAVHELLFDPSRSGPPVFLATVAARLHAVRRPFVWIDPSSLFYPPAVALHIENLHLLRPRISDLTWATAECLRCRYVGAVIAVIPQRLTRVEVRRLQLAAEQGGTVGILVRPNIASAGSHIYSAASRWLILPEPGEQTIQRWRIEHVHGHGRQITPSFILEKHRGSEQTNYVHPSAALADHQTTAADLGKLSEAAS